MNKTFLSVKISPEKLIPLIMRVVLIVFVLFIAFIAYMLHQNSLRNKYDEKRALNYLNEIYEYVKENEEVFMEFSEYQRSLIEDSETRISIERTGDMQEQRDIVFEHFGSGRAGYRPDDQSFFVCYNGSYIAVYGMSFEMTLWFGKDIAKDKDEWKWSKKINDDMYIVMLRAAHF